MNLTYCPDPDCAGKDCTRIPHWEGHRGLGLSMSYAAALFENYLRPWEYPEYFIGMIEGPFLTSVTKDAAGNKRLLPLDASFELHSVRVTEGDVLISAEYSGDVPVEDLLANAPAWSEEALRQREDLAKEAKRHRPSRPGEGVAA